jgi:ankyrin repeat protein
MTVLMAAASKGNLEMVKLLIEKGADVEDKDKDGATVLVHATLMGNPEIVRFLIDKGADVNAQTSQGLTALMMAADQGNLEIVKFLIEKGADVNAKKNTYYGLSAFLVSIARTLQDRDLSHLVGPGRTALERAQERGHKEIVEYLKAHGAKE